MNLPIRCFAAAIFALGAFQLAAADIGTAAEFVAAMNSDPAGKHKLTADIDLTGSGYTSVPEFTGSLNGCGHKITGLGAQPLIITNRGELAAFTLDGTTASGNTTFKDDSKGCVCVCSYDGRFIDLVVAGYSIRTKSADTRKPMALFAAFAYNGTEFVRCATDASAKVIKGATYNDEAAFVGILSVTNIAGVGARFINCTNNSTVVTSDCWSNDTPGSGGFIAIFQGVGGVDIPEVQFIRCVNNGDVILSHASRNAGGFIGRCQGGNASSNNKPTLLRFVQCINNGSVTGKVGSVAGGFVGYTWNQTMVRFESCVNRGDIGGEGVSTASAFLGKSIGERTSSLNCPDTYINSANYGDVTGKIVGGFFGFMTAKYSACYARANIYNCADYGTVNGSQQMGYLFGKEGDGGVGAINLNNDWIAATPVYSNALHLASMTNIHTNDTDVAGLNAIATETAGYMPWVLGASGKPELACFATTCSDAAIPVVFCDWSGTVLKKEFVAKGGSATPPKVAKYEGLACLGWSRPYQNVQSVTVCNAIYGHRGLTIVFR